MTTLLLVAVATGALVLVATGALVLVATGALVLVATGALVLVATGALVLVATGALIAGAGLAGRVLALILLVLTAGVFVAVVFAGGDFAFVPFGVENLVFCANAVEQQSVNARKIQEHLILLLESICLHPIVHPISIKKKSKSSHSKISVQVNTTCKFNGEASATASIL